MTGAAHPHSSPARAHPYARRPASTPGCAGSTGKPDILVGRAPFTVPIKRKWQRRSAHGHPLDNEAVAVLQFNGSLSRRRSPLLDRAVYKGI